MNDIFTIIIDKKSLEVINLSFKGYCAAYGISKKKKTSFILVCNETIKRNPKWHIDYTGSSIVSHKYIDKIITAIDSHYSLKLV